MQHGQKEDRKGIGTRIRVGNREGNCADNGLAALIYYFGQKWLIFITFQSAIKMNEFQFWSFFGKIPRF